jgi:hypothetical protein
MEPPTPGVTQAGLDRRTVIRRGAILGGALVWTAPAVQTIAGPAFAAGTPCVPGITVFIDTDANGRYDAGTDECIGTATFTNGSAQGADCCECFESTGANAAALTVCLTNGQCAPVLTSPGIC